MRESQVLAGECESRPTGDGELATKRTNIGIPVLPPILAATTINIILSVISNTQLLTLPTPRSLLVYICSEILIRKTTPMKGMAEDEVTDRI